MSSSSDSQCTQNSCHSSVRVAPHVGFNRYGKSLVRMIKLTKVPQRDGSVRHDMREVNVRLTLEGDFDASYAQGDNSNVIPTDTQKNTVYIVGKHWNSGEIEDLAIMLARHFMLNYSSSHVTGVHVDIKEDEWERLIIDGQEHNHAFTKKHPHVRFCRLYADRRNTAQLVSGFTGLTLLKTTKSGFVKYWKDQFTTLPECSDRMMRSSVHAEWTYTKEHCDRIASHIRSGRKGDCNTSDAVRQVVQLKFSSMFRVALDIMTREFAGEPVQGTMSWSVQQTLYDAGVKMLNGESNMENVYLNMPNMHVFLYDLKRFNIENDNEVWWLTDEPHGLIEACVTRSNNHCPNAGKDKLQPFARI